MYMCLCILYIEREMHTLVAYNIHQEFQDYPHLVTTLLLHFLPPYVFLMKLNGNI